MNPRQEVIDLVIKKYALQRLIVELDDAYNYYLSYSGKEHSPDVLEAFYVGYAVGEEK